MTSLPPPPVTPIDNFKYKLHGTEIIDPYQWLEDSLSQKTQSWLLSQSQYTRLVLDSMTSREEIKRRLETLEKVDYLSLPLVRGQRYFYSKRSAHQNRSSLAMRIGSSRAESILIDPDSISSDPSISVNFLDISANGNLLNYAVRSGGEDEVSLSFFNVQSRQHLPDQLPKGRYFSIAITPDLTGCYYCRHEPQGPRVYYHTIGQTHASDREIFGQGYGRDKLIEAQLSENGAYLIITVFHNSILAGPKSEIYYLDLVNNGSIVSIVNDIDARFTPKCAGNHLFVLTNWQAPNRRIFKIDLQNPSREHWQEAVPQSDAVIQDFVPANGELLVHYLENVCSVLKVYSPSGEYLPDFSQKPKKRGSKTATM